MEFLTFTLQCHVQKPQEQKAEITKLLNAIREILIGMGLVEIINFSLVSKKGIQFELVGAESNIKNAISVDETKSNEYEVSEIL